MIPPLSVRIKRIGDWPVPRYMTLGAAGADVYAALECPVVLYPGSIKVIPCGFAIALPVGFEAQLRPRSGWALNHGITLINSPGTIDSDFRGEVCAGLVNHGELCMSVLPGDRIAQLVIAPVERACFEVVPDLESTVRGTKGFGSTGS